MGLGSPLCPAWKALCYSSPNSPYPHGFHPPHSDSSLRLPCRNPRSGEPGRFLFCREGRQDVEDKCLAEGHTACQGRRRDGTSRVSPMSWNSMTWFSACQGASFTVKSIFSESFPTLLLIFCFGELILYSFPSLLPSFLVLLSYLFIYFSSSLLRVQSGPLESCITEFSDLSHTLDEGR